MTELSVHNVKTITARKIKQFDDFVSRDIVVRTEKGEKIVLNLFGKSKENLLLELIESKKEGEE